MARPVAAHFQELGMVRILALKVPVDLPSIGMITLRSQRLTTTTEQLMECIRRVASKRLQADARAKLGVLG